MPISIKLIFYFLTISISLIFVIGIFSYKKAEDALISRTYDQLISIRIEKEKRVSNFFNQRINNIQNISNNEDTKDLLSQLTKPKTKSIFSKYIYGYLQAGSSYKKITFIDKASQILSYRLTEDYFIKDTTNIDLSFYSDFLGDSIKNHSVVISENSPTNENPLINIGINVYNDINKKTVGSNV